MSEVEFFDVTNELDELVLKYEFSSKQNNFILKSSKKFTSAIDETIKEFIRVEIKKPSRLKKAF